MNKHVVNPHALRDFVIIVLLILAWDSVLIVLTAALAK